jgi:hypothetical protein
MANLNLTHEQIRTHMFGMHQLAEHERHAAADALIKLQTKDDWHPEALRRELHALQSAGKLNEATRHVIEKKFFPGHTW